MPPLKDFIAIIISVIALAVSFWSARRGWRFNLASLRKASRNDYMTALLDIDRQLITNPQLWAVYGTTVAPTPSTATGQEQEDGRRLAFIWYRLNLYEMVWTEFHVDRVTPLDYDDRRFWESWDRYVRSFLAKSAEARTVVANDDSMKLLQGFRRIPARLCATTQAQAAPATLRSFVTSLLMSSALVAPFIVLQLANRRALHEDFPFVLFTFMSLHSLFIVLSVMPALRRLRSERSLGALKLGHWAGLALSAFLMFVYADVVIDQLPCFLGVPNCD